jgi:transposase-like protein
MTPRRTSPLDDRSPGADDGGSGPDDQEDAGGHIDVGATVACPYCGAPNEIALDPSGGRRQDYVEDCQVCCQPWNVRVQYHRDGTADVRVDAANAD